MNVACSNAFDSFKTANFHIFTDGKNHVLQVFLNGSGVACKRFCKKFIHVCRIGIRNRLGNRGNIVYEFFVLRNEVGFGVNFNQYADFLCFVGIGKDDTFRSDSAGFLSGSGKTFFTKHVDCALHIAVCFGQSFFAVHHTNAGFFTQRFNISSSKCHENSS